MTESTCVFTTTGMPLFTTTFLISTLVLSSGQVKAQECPGMYAYLLDAEGNCINLEELTDSTEAPTVRPSAQNSPGDFQELETRTPFETEATPPQPNNNPFSSNEDTAETDEELEDAELPDLEDIDLPRGTWEIINELGNEGWILYRPSSAYAEPFIASGEEVEVRLVKILNVLRSNNFEPEQFWFMGQCDDRTYALEGNLNFDDSYLYTAFFRLIREPYTSVLNTLCQLEQRGSSPRLR